MTGPRALGRVIAVGLEGPRVTSREERAILDHGVGAFILFERNLPSIDAALALTDALRDLAWRATGGPPLILIDEEGGLISEARRLGTPAPAAMALGALGEPALAREWGWRVGRRLALLGTGLALAPVLDVNTERENPVIGFRAYGGDTDLVTRLGLAAMEGLRSAGVLPAPKHFPGHGGVAVDSHERLPRSRDASPEAAAPHVTPFRAAIGAGAPAILAAHLAAPGLAGGSNAPATLEPAILTRLLRGSLGFGGAVITDDLAMGALADACRSDDVPARALAAGADLLLYASGFEGGGAAGVAGAIGATAALDALRRALGGGGLAPERLADAAARVDALAHLSDDALAGAAAASRCGAGAAERAVALAAFEADDRDARAQLVIVQERGPREPAIAPAPFPLPAPEGVAILVPSRLEGRRRRAVPWPPAAGDALASLRPRLVRFPYDPTDADVEALVAAVGAGRPAVVGLLARGALPRGQALLASRLLARRAPTLPVALLNPLVLDGLAPSRGLATFGIEPEEIAALGRVLAGRTRALPPPETDRPRAPRAIAD
jgi:beta-N-acetylhexosaminidase